MVKTKWRKAKGLRYCVMKSQSAMEYLMTYGWAILIIAVVLGALFQLGVFNSMTFAPKAQPGACQVYRPNGPGTTQFINTVGPCNGEIPQFVAQFNGNGGITVSNPIGEPSGTQPATATFWFSDPNPAGEGEVHFFSYGNEVCTGQAFTTGVSNAELFIDTWCTQIFAPYTIKANTSYFGTVEINSTSEKVCIEGTSTGGLVCNSESITPNVAGSTPIYMGIWPSRPNYVGKLANIQFYNTYLSQPEIQALYQEGIGGAPLRLQNLVGWWPLNGNANDYSGNNNNGNAINVTYTTGWYSGYSAP